VELVLFHKKRENPANDSSQGVPLNGKAGLFVPVLFEVHLGRFIRVLLRARLIPLRALRVMSRRLVLASGDMLRRRLMVFRGIFTTVRSLRVLFLCF
jgi:hypothetical protein